VYAGQGLEVSEEVIAQGVQAMREDRFTYRPPPRGLQTMLARLYVDRGRWARRAGMALLVLIGLWAGYRYMVVGPAERGRQQAAEVSRAVAALRAEALAEAVEAGVGDKIEAIYQEALAAQQAGDARKVRTSRDALQAIRDALRQVYTLQVVSRPGMPSGVWRYPVDSRSGRNYYLIVEAVSPSGQRLSLPITSEEDGTVRTVAAWGLRVERQVYERVGQDKMDDGIVNEKTVGSKRRGYLTPDYAVATTGATITEW
ncbi:MAG TPA: DUF6384 family protein, partial [Desulfobacterales bacterium]|nr:DUF6384 family protein [Desulfobacterales bacterium]